MSLNERFVSAEFRPARLRSVLGFALALDVRTVGAFGGLDVLELSALVPDGVEPLACAAAVGGASCFLVHSHPIEPLHASGAWVSQAFHEAVTSDASG